MSEIVLLYPYVYKQTRNAMLFHPLGIAQVSAMLRKEGMNSSIMDLTFRNIDEALVELTHAQPRIVGIYVMLTMIENALQLARKIRKSIPDVLLVCGGPMPTLRPEQFIPDFDIVLRGEAVNSFPRFCRDYLESDSILDMLREHDRYPGLYALSPQNGMVLETRMLSVEEDELDLLPIPDRKDFNHTLYQKFWQEREGYSPAGIMTTYGCPHNCDFCSKPIFGTYFRRRRMERIMEEIRDIRSRGYDGLWIADDCFTLDLGHIRAFCSGMIRENLKMRWTCLSRTEPIPQEDIMLMRQAGCRKVFFGLESGSNAVLKLMNKHTTIEAAENTIRLFSECSIETAGFFMVGYPGETYETIETTFAWALTLPLTEISFTIPFPLPNTTLYQKAYGLKADADWSYENENRMIFQSEFDEDYLRRRIEETCSAFDARQKNSNAVSSQK